MTSEDAPATTATGGRRKRTTITPATAASIAYLVKNFTSPAARRPPRPRRPSASDAHPRGQPEEEEDDGKPRRRAEPAVDQMAEPEADGERRHERQPHRAQLADGAQDLGVGPVESQRHRRSNATTKTRKHEEENFLFRVLVLSWLPF